MSIIGITAEFDPFHRGHEYLIRSVRERYPGSAVVAAMSGSYTQRGGPAAVRPHARAEMALSCGADLVLELPLTWAISSAEGFGLGGVSALSLVGVDTLAFGSECGNARLLRQAADCLTHPAFPDTLKKHLSEGISFAEARQQAVSELAGDAVGAVLSSPNDLLGVSYLAAVERLGVSMQVCPIVRTGPGHNSAEIAEGFASASTVRSLLAQGRLDEAKALLPQPVCPILQKEWDAGLTPASLTVCERAVLYRLRQMSPSDFLALPDCSEGLENRLYRAARQAVSLEEFYDLAKTRRYAHSRIRRLTLWAFLGMTSADRPDTLPYLRVLGMNEHGQQVLRSIKKTCPVPILTKPAAAKRLPEAAQRLFELEMRGADLWRLCLNTPQSAGQGWKESAVILRNGDNG